MVRTYLIAGTASHVGKSTVAAGLCRVLADAGVRVAPFKAQNMSNNARAVATPDGGFGEIGVSQYVQARAARIPATTDHNPVLLKPRGGGESQLVIDGRAVGHFAAGDYYDEHWERARAAAEASWRRLAADHDVIVAEGAGSVAEINLHHRDLANVETARFADRGSGSVRIVLVADIERGGVFASLAGTLELMPDDLRERVVGCVITKFRGDRSLLDPGVEAFEDRFGVPVLGVLPYDDPGLPEEDSVSLPAGGGAAVRGADDGVPDDRAVTVAVPRLPRISNFTDLDPLAREPGVRVTYLPLDAPLDGADALVLPGTKNTVDDLLALRAAGFGDRLAAFDGPVVGLCGGYQLLGERLANASVEGTGDADELDGFGLLPVETRFEGAKRVEPVTRTLTGCGPLAGASGRVSGYEIHMGRTRPRAPIERPFPAEGERGAEGAATDRVFGTYLHGLFENRIAREAFLDAVYAHRGVERPRAVTSPSPYDRAARLVREHVDLAALSLP
ncbi:cobyric acid synthase [Halomarina pelagica]|uniref:cobyric acid synthase n=1 Tax=Halomarina pelagica TaxID=2961599 RepID=UPI0020C33D0A|nr:cobyric acid synthase [Halomarina sp. BND7]